MAEEHNYKIEGSGKTTQIANQAVDLKLKGLTKKLKKGKVSQEINIIKTTYSGHYSLSTSEKGDLVNATADFNDKSSWPEVELCALKKFTNLNNYQPIFTKKSYLKLSDKQLGIATGKGLPAEKDQRSYSFTKSITDLVH
ncbi:MAG: hypothetical protein WCX73_03330 [Candidatus Pacearchaeota archaeon]|jgi:hypothetical protein